MEKNEATVLKVNGKLKIKDKKYKDHITDNFIDNPKINPPIKEGDNIIYISFVSEGGKVVNVIKEVRR